MTILSDRQLIELGDAIIKPFVQGQVKEIGPDKVISFGVSSYGYDVRLDNKFQVYTPYLELSNFCIDPKCVDEIVYEYVEDDFYELAPGESVLVQTLETISIPEDCLVRVELKSTYARCHLMIAPVVLEPEWSGKVTLAVTNNSQCQVMLRAYEGFAQLVFHQGSERCQVSYADRKGKYQNQTGITVARV